VGEPPGQPKASIAQSQTPGWPGRLHRVVGRAGVETGLELREGQVFGCGGGLRDRNAVFPQSADVHFDSLVHSAGGLIPGLAGGNTAGKVWRIGREIALSLLDDNRKAMHGHFPLGLLKAACLRTVLSVPGARSSLGWPAIVTRPGFWACLNWRWLRFVATMTQPWCAQGGRARIAQPARLISDSTSARPAKPSQAKDKLNGLHVVDHDLLE